jgi:hypothetical protein
LPQYGVVRPGLVISGKIKLPLARLYPDASQLRLCIWLTLPLALMNRGKRHLKECRQMQGGAEPGDSWNVARY